MSKCIGCGVKLQNSNKDSLGYTPKIDNKYCERCFKTMHYNNYIEVDNLDNDKIIDKINKINYFTIFITDIFSLNNNLINIFKSIKNKKVLVINKCDILPKNIKLEHIKENIKSSYKIGEDVIFISAKKELFLNKIVNLIEENTNVIFCGETSSGKSTLINKLLDKNLTTSKYNNTTLDFIKINYDKYIMYDTPGILLNKNKKVSEKCIIKTKQISNDYILYIDDIKIKCKGNLTIIGNEFLKEATKKDNSNLNKTIMVEDNSDIVFDNGFIYIKNKINISCDKEIEIRKSIIGR